GISLLRGKLSVWSASQNVLASCEAGSPENGNLVEAIANVQPGASYYIRVERAAGANDFAVGQYRVQINFNPYVPGSADTGDGSTTVWVFNDDHTDDSIASAKILADNPGNPGVY